MSDRGYSPDLPCRPPRRFFTLCDIFGLAVRVACRQAYKIASKIVMAFLPPEYCRLFALKKAYKGVPQEPLTTPLLSWSSFEAQHEPLFIGTDCQVIFLSSGSSIGLNTP